MGMWPLPWGRGRQAQTADYSLAGSTLLGIFACASRYGGPAGFSLDYEPGKDLDAHVWLPTAEREIIPRALSLGLASPVTARASSFGAGPFAAPG